MKLDNPNGAAVYGAGEKRALRFVNQQPFGLRRAVQQGGRTGVVADLSPVMKKRNRAAIGIGAACNLVFMSPLVRPIRRPLWSFGPPFIDRRLVAVRCALR